jgi:hypothetical protein
MNSFVKSLVKMRFRWQLISIVVLLCQGFVFEHEDSIQETTYLFFGVTASFMILAVLAYSIVDLIWKKLKRRRSVCLSKPAFAALSESLQQDILQIYSEEQLDKQGVFVLDKKTMNLIGPGQRQEVLGIISKEFVLDSRAFELFMLLNTASGP